ERLTQKAIGTCSRESKRYGGANRKTSASPHPSTSSSALHGSMRRPGSTGSKRAYSDRDVGVGSHARGPSQGQGDPRPVRRIERTCNAFLTPEDVPAKIGRLIAEIHR